MNLSNNNNKHISNNNTNKVLSEVAASNMTQLTTSEEILHCLLDAGEASQAKVQWGKCYRNVVMFKGEKYPYQGFCPITKRLVNKNVCRPPS